LLDCSLLPGQAAKAGDVARMRDNSAASTALERINQRYNMDYLLDLIANNFQCGTRAPAAIAVKVPVSDRQIST
jgi:hypothetical protein